jgi:ATP-dependent Clp protease ATP-binding subunit ClpA
LYALINEEFELFDAAMKSLAIDSETVRAAVEKRVENGFQFIGRGFRIAPQTIEFFRFSTCRAHLEGRQVIDSTDLLSVFTNEKRDLLNDILQNPEHQVIASLKTDVEQCLKQNQLKITKTKSLASRFIFEYETENLTGKIHFSGKIMRNYFQLIVRQHETYLKKI